MYHPEFLEQVSTSISKHDPQTVMVVVVVFDVTTSKYSIDATFPEDKMTKQVAISFASHITARDAEELMNEEK